MSKEMIEKALTGYSSSGAAIRSPAGAKQTYACPAPRGRRSLWYNRGTMSRIIFAVLMLAAVAGCSPDDGAAEMNKADAAYSARDLAPAAALYRAAAEKNPTNLVARFRLATVQMELGDIPAAKAAADEALALDPDSAEIVLLCGQISYFAKDYKRARSDFGKVASAKDLAPALRSQALSSLAVLEMAESRFDHARVALWRAIRIDIRNAAAWYHLGYLSRDVYRFDEAAVEQFEMAGRLSKDPARAKEICRDILPALRESLRTKAAGRPGAATRDPGAAAKLVSEGEALAKKSPAKAAAKFAAAYAKDPFSYAAAWNHAKALSASAKKDSEISAALEAFQDAIAQKPNSQDAYRTAARAALAHKRPMRAEKFLSQALAHDPASKPTLALYVQALSRNGKRSEARLYEAYMKEL